MENRVNFKKKLIKQGNSYCVRIPKNIIDKHNLNINDEILVSIIPQKRSYLYNEKNMLEILNKSNKIARLDKFSKEKKRLFIALNFRYLEETKGPNPEIIRKKKILFIQERKKEYGERLVKEFIEFSTILNKEILD